MVEPPPSDDFTLLFNCSANSLADAPPPEKGLIPLTIPMELVTSLPAPKISVPFELAVLFARPITLLAIPE